MISTPLGKRLYVYVHSKESHTENKKKIHQEGTVCNHRMVQFHVICCLSKFSMMACITFIIKKKTCLLESVLCSIHLTGQSSLT